MLFIELSHREKEIVVTTVMRGKRLVTTCKKGPELLFAGEKRSVESVVLIRVTKDIFFGCENERSLS